jgi:hypothetical protein
MGLIRTSSFGLLVLTGATAATAPGCGSGDATTAKTTEALAASTTSSVTSTLPGGARIWLTSAVLTRLRARAAAGDAGWQTLSGRCNTDASATVSLPGGNAYPDPPGIGQGYQGDGYIPEILALGLCYQTAAGVDDASATRWAQAGARVLAAMATPAGSGGESPGTDDGYGIRNYGVGMAIGYDWLRPALDAGTKASVQAALDAWITWYDASGFIHDEPVGNYFAGYLFAKGAAAIALDGDDAQSAAWWSDITTRMWPALAEPAYKAALAGGGWPEGWQYGPLSVRNLVGFLWAASTGKGVSWWDDVPLAHAEAAYIGEFAWPSRKHMDDRGTVHAQAVLSPSASTVAMTATVMEQQGDAFASTARGVASDLAAATHEAIDPWQQFLFWDAGAKASASSTLPASYLASGPGHVAMRSSWTTDATWASFASGPYLDAQDSGEQYFDQGGLAIASGDAPIVVNATGWLPQADSDSGESFVYDDTWGSRTRLLDNTFYVAGATQDGIARPAATTRVERYEDGGLYVRARGAAIEQMYSPSGVVTQFTRDLAYVRPGTFIVYDRTTADAKADQWIAWHVPGAPTQSASADGTARFDMPTGATIRALLPRGAKATTTNVLDKVTRVEVHSSAAAQDWLTAISVSGAPAVERLSAADGNVMSGAVVGAHVAGATRATRESVVLFSSDHAGAAQTTSAAYEVTQATDADHMLFDVAPGSYSATAAADANGKITVQVTAGGPLKPSAGGTLAFSVSPAGVVTADTAPTAPAGTSIGATNPVNVMGQQAIRAANAKRN